MSQEYILYYSERCKFSNNFLTKIKTNPKIFNSMTKIEISKTRRPIPPYIKSVPSLLITSNGQTNLLVNKNLFDWCNANSQSSQGSGGGGGGGGIMDWDPMAMSGGSYSDTFSFIDNNNATEKNFSFLDTSTQQINCPQDDSQYAKGEDYNKKPINQDLEKLMEQRRQDVPSGPARI